MGREIKRYCPERPLATHIMQPQLRSSNKYNFRFIVIKYFSFWILRWLSCSNSVNVNVQCSLVVRFCVYSRLSCRILYPSIGSDQRQCICVLVYLYICVFVYFWGTLYLCFPALVLTNGSGIKRVQTYSYIPLSHPHHHSYYPPTPENRKTFSLKQTKSGTVFCTSWN